MAENPWLDALKPLMLPDPIGYWPLASGWWWLLLLLLIQLLLLAAFLYRRWLRNGYRRQALLELAQIQHDQHRLPELPQLLRRVARAAGLSAYRRPGEEGWWRCLDQAIPQQPFCQGLGEQLELLGVLSPTQLRALPPEVLDRLFQAADTFIRRHRQEVG